MKHIIQNDLHGKAYKYVEDTYGSEVLWTFPNLHVELTGKLLSGYTEEMVNEWLLVNYGLLQPVIDVEPEIEEAIEADGVEAEVEIEADTEIEVVADTEVEVEAEPEVVESTAKRKR